MGAKKLMATSPYALIGAKLVDNGYAAIPIAPGTKRPGTRQFGRWYSMSEWTRYCDRLPTEIELGIWNEWPDAGVCVALDHRLKVIDIDTDDQALLVAMCKVLPASPVKKRGRKGFSAFYRGSPEIVSAPFSITTANRPVRVVDLLAHGRQTVLPPTLHPDTGRPYEWTDSDTLVDTPIDGLPELPDDITARLAEVLKPFGYTPDERRPLVTGEGDTMWRGINETALLNLDKWVPALELPKTRRNHNGYRAVAAWRGVENANLSFHKNGIKDWGAGEAYTPIDVVMVARGVDFGAAVGWLRAQLGIEEDPRDDVEAFIARAKAKRTATRPQ
jgi:hypothetical protein